MRRGYFVIDKIALVGQSMTCHLIPDGKMSSMSKLGSKIDAKEMNKGKGESKDVGKQKAEKKLDDQGNEILSKKDLAKLAKKEKKDAAKSGNPLPEQPKGPRPNQQASASVVPKPAVAHASGSHINALEAHIGCKTWMNGSSPSQDDVDALAAVGSVPPNPMVHPNLFGWFCATTRFMP